MKRKRLLALTLSLCVAASVCGCGGGNGGGKTADGKTVIKIGGWPAGSGSDFQKYESMREEFMKDSPDIKVETDVWGFDLNTFLPKAASGQLPDMYITSFTEIKRIIDSGYASDVTKYMDEYKYTDYLRDDIKELISKDGKLYSVPQDAYIMGLYINLNMFEKAGLLNSDGTPKIPKTWDELGQMAGEIKKKTGEAGFTLPTMQNCGGWHFVNIAWAFGTNPQFMKQVDGKWKADFATPETKAALEFVRDLKYKYDAIPENALMEHNEMIKMFATDRNAMMLATPPQDSLTQTHKMDKNKIAIVGMPAGPKGRFTQMGGNLRVLRNGLSDSQIEGCFKWLDFIGVSPNITEESKKSREELMKINAEKDKLIGVKNFSMWKQGSDAPEIEKFEGELIDKYRNVDSKMFEDFSKSGNEATIVPEPPVSCQQLYNILDGCIQEVLLKPDADIDGILKKAQNDFQINYLDKTE